MFNFNLRPNEKLQRVIRQTEWTLLKPLVIILVLVYVPWFFILKYELFGQFYRLIIFWSVILLLFGLNNYLVWLVNVCVITDQRVVVIKYQNLLNKKVTEAPLNKILNINFSKKGVLSTLFNFGEVRIQLTHGQDSIVIPKTREPEELQNFLASFAKG